MNNLFYLEHISKTRKIDFNLTTRQEKLDLMARFIEIKAMNRELKQTELGKTIKTLKFYIATI